MAAHLLLVEDNSSMIEIIREILESEGYRVTCAGDGLAALEAFKREPPDLILSDVMMPNMDGFALLQAVRSHPGGAVIPFLFITAHTERIVASGARALGADDFLIKPFEPDELTTAVRTKLERNHA